MVVRDTPPPNHTMTVGRMYQTSPLPEPEPVFSTVVRLEEDDEKGLDEAETKVVRRGRRPAAKASEVAETK